MKALHVLPRSAGADFCRSGAALYRNSDVEIPDVGDLANAAPALRYAVALYGATIFANSSAIPKLVVITVCAFFLTMAAHMLLGVLFLLYFVVFRGGVPFSGPV